MTTGRLDQGDSTLLTVPLGTKRTIRVIDAAGTTIATLERTESATARQFFSEPFVSDR